MNKRLFFLFTVLSGILLGVGFLLGGILGLTIGLGIAFIINIFSYYNSDSWILKMYNAKSMRKMDYPEIYSAVKSMCKKADIPLPKLYMIDKTLPNAFAVGRDPSHSAVALTTGLLSELSVDEIEGVLAHEISHIKHRDTLINMIASVMGAAITYLSYMFLFGEKRGGGGLLMFVLAPLSAGLLRMAISRGREFYADKEGADIKSPTSLASALEKIEEISKKHNMKGNAATSNLFIVNPFRGGISDLFSTHPPTEERVRRLRSMTV